MKSKLLYITLIAVTFSISAQDFNDTISSPNELLHVRSAKEFRNIIKVAPLKVLGLFHPSIDLLYERRWTSRIATQITVGHVIPVIFRKCLSASNYDYKYSGHKFALEARYYVMLADKFRAYAGAEAGFNRYSFRETVPIERSVPYIDTTTMYSDYLYLDTINVHALKKMLTAKFGASFEGKHWFIELSGGIGLKQKNIWHTERMNPEDEVHFMPEIDFNVSKMKPTKYYTLSLPANIFVGFKF